MLQSVPLLGRITFHFLDRSLPDLLIIHRLTQYLTGKGVLFAVYGCVPVISIQLSCDLSKQNMQIADSHFTAVQLTQLELITTGKQKVHAMVFLPAKLPTALQNKFFNHPSIKQLSGKYAGNQPASPQWNMTEILSKER